MTETPWTISEWLTLLGAFGALITAVTAGCIKLWPVYREWRAERRVDDKLNDDKVVKGYELVVTDLRDRLTKNESRLAHVEAELLKSSIECSRLQAENAALMREVKRLEASLAEWRREHADAD